MRTKSTRPAIALSDAYGQRADLLSATTYPSYDDAKKAVDDWQDLIGQRTYISKEIYPRKRGSPPESVTLICKSAEECPFTCKIELQANARYCISFAEAEIIHTCNPGTVPTVKKESSYPAIKIPRSFGQHVKTQQEPTQAKRTKSINTWRNKVASSSSSSGPPSYKTRWPDSPDNQRHSDDETSMSEEVIIKPSFGIRKTMRSRPPTSRARAAAEQLVSAVAPKVNAVQYRENARDQRASIGPAQAEHRSRKKGAPKVPTLSTSVETPPKCKPKPKPESKARPPRIISSSSEDSSHSNAPSNRSRSSTSSIPSLPDGLEDLFQSPTHNGSCNYPDEILKAQPQESRTPSVVPSYEERPDKPIIPPKVPQGPAGLLSPTDSIIVMKSRLLSRTAAHEGAKPGRRLDQDPQVEQSKDPSTNAKQSIAKRRPDDVNIDDNIEGHGREHEMRSAKRHKPAHTPEILLADKRYGIDASLTEYLANRGYHNLSDITRLGMQEDDMDDFVRGVYAEMDREARIGAEDAVKKCARGIMVNKFKRLFSNSS